jgi:hypothetical protein
MNKTSQTIVAEDGSIDYLDLISLLKYIKTNNLARVQDFVSLHTHFLWWEFPLNMKFQ